MGGRVAVELEEESGHAVLRATDSGAGLSPEQIERVFEMFARVPRPGMGTQPGLGIAVGAGGARREARAS